MPTSSASYCAVALVLAGGFLVGCPKKNTDDGGNPPPGRVLAQGSATLGTAGGTINAGDVTLVVPPGALASDVALTIREDPTDVPPPAFDLSTRLVRFEPHGTSFAQPVTVSFPRPPSGRPRIYWSRGYGQPYLPLLTSIEGDRVTARVNHFSLGGLVDEAWSSGQSTAQDFLDNNKSTCTPTGPVCPPLPVPNTTPCATSGDCGGGQVCINFFCTAPQCGSGVNCPFGFECDDGACKSAAVGRLCGAACSSNGDCRPGLECFESRCLIRAEPTSISGSVAVSAEWVNTADDGVALWQGRPVGLLWDSTMGMDSQNMLLCLPQQDDPSNVVCAEGGVTWPFQPGGAILTPLRSTFFDAPAGGSDGILRAGPQATINGGCAMFRRNTVMLPMATEVSSLDVHSSDLVTVRGSALLNAQVAIGDTPAVVEGSTQNELVFRVPPAATGGALVLTTPVGRSVAARNATRRIYGRENSDSITERSNGTVSRTFGAFTFRVSPLISTVTPNAARAGETFEIAGGRLFEGTADTTTVRLGGLDVAITNRAVVGANQVLRCVVPAGAHSDILSVTTPSGSLTWPQTFYVLPTWGGVQPASGTPGTRFTITGSEFDEVTTVLFGDEPLDALLLGAGEIRGVVPRVPPGEYAIQLVTFGGKTNAPAPFLVPAPLFPVHISRLYPNTGVVGDLLAVDGSGMADVNRITFQGSPSSVRVDALYRKVDDSRVIVTVPQGAVSGSVLVYNPVGFASVPFTLAEPVVLRPILNSFSPTRASRGAYLHLTGAGFLGVTHVNFNVGASSQPTAVPVTPADDANIVVRIPQTARDGYLEAVKPTFSPSRSSTRLTVVEWQLPVVEFISPPQGPSGTEVLTTGRDLDALGTVELLPLTLPAAPIPVTFTVHSDRTLSFTAVAPPAVYDVMYTTRSGFAPLIAARFEVTSDTLPPLSSAPTVTGVFPAASATGGTLEVMGNNLDSAMGTPVVFVNGTPATVVDRSNDLLEVALPPGSTTGPIFVGANGYLAVSGTPVLVLGEPTAPLGAQPRVVETGPLPVLVGGTWLLRGLAMSAVSNVLVAGLPAAYQVFSDDELEVHIPLAAPVGDWVVTLQTLAGINATVAVSIVGRGLPNITGMSPGAGPAGTVVRVSGDGFTGLAQVMFSGLAGPASVPALFQFIDDTAFQVAVPPGALTGPVEIQAPDVGAARTVNTPVFTVTGGGGPVGTRPPGITSFDPVQGPTGTVVTVYGTDFDGATRVAFRGVPAAFTLQGTTVLTAAVPYGAATGPITVVTPVDGATSSADFTVVPALPPVLTGITPPVGASGIGVTLSGVGLTGLASVLFDVVPALVLSATDTDVLVQVPFGLALGTVNVTVTTANGTTSTVFQVIPPAGPVLVDSTPDSARRGDVVTVTGTGFLGLTSATLDGTPATLAVTNDTTLSVVVPAGVLTGVHTWTVQGPLGTAVSGEAFTVLPSPPSITGVAPGSGAGGVAVVVAGTDFVGVSAVMAELTVAPGARIPAAFTANSATSLTVTIPSTAGAWGCCGSLRRTERQTSRSNLLAAPPRTRSRSPVREAARARSRPQHLPAPSNAEQRARPCSRTNSLLF